MTPGVLSVASEERVGVPGAAAGREVELAPPRLRRVADVEGESAHRAGDGQPALAAPLRRRHRPHAEQLRQDGRAAVASGAARLAGARVHRSRLEPEADAPADVDVARLSDGERRHPGQRQRSIRRTGCSGARRASGSRPKIDSRRDPGRDAARSIARSAARRSSRTSIRISSRRARGAPGAASPTTTRRPGGAASTCSSSAASAIRCSRRSISRTSSTRPTAAIGRRSRPRR